MHKPKTLQHELTLHWAFTLSLLIMLISFNLICHLLSKEIQIHLIEEQRILIRSIFYFIAIILFPMTSLIRHILIRLNETMPVPSNNSAKYRYLFTIIMTLGLIELTGLLGFIMFILGDDFNTLYIFSLLSLLGLFLYRPKHQEFNQIIDALKQQLLTDKKTEL